VTVDCEEVVEDDFVGLLSSDFVTGSVFLGLSHNVSAPFSRNHGGNGLRVVVVVNCGEQAKCTSTYLFVPGQGSPKTLEFTFIRQERLPSHLK